MERQGEAGPDAFIRADHVRRYEWAAEVLCKRFAGLDPLTRRYLDAGCGVGYGSIILALLRPARVLGVDIEEGAIRRAETRVMHMSAPESQTIRPHFVRADIQRPEGWEAINPYLQQPAMTTDAVVWFENIEHLDDPISAAKYFASILRKPHGVLLVSAPNEDVVPFRREDFAGDRYPHLRHYTRETLAWELECAGFVVTKWFGQEGKKSKVEPDVNGRTLVAMAELK